MEQPTIWGLVYEATHALTAGFETAAAEMGREGGKARARNLSPQARSESARKAALARWRKNEVNVTDAETAGPL